MGFRGLGGSKVLRLSVATPRRRDFMIPASANVLCPGVSPPPPNCSNPGACRLSRSGFATSVCSCCATDGTSPSCPEAPTAGSVWAPCRPGTWGRGGLGRLGWVSAGSGGFPRGWEKLETRRQRGGDTVGLVHPSQWQHVLII